MPIGVARFGVASAGRQSTLYNRHWDLPNQASTVRRVMTFAHFLDIRAPTYLRLLVVGNRARHSSP